MIDSALTVPGLMIVPSDSGEAIDVSIKIGATPATLRKNAEQGARYQVARDELLLWFDRVAKYHITNGKCITVEPLGDLATGDVAELLLTMPLAGLLLQRGAMVLHSCAVATELGAILIVGRSVSGKSTLAAWLAQRGMKFMSDGFTSVEYGAGGVPYVNPGHNRIRLWDQSAEGILAKDIPVFQPQGILQKISADFSSMFQCERKPLTKVILLDVSVLGRKYFEAVPMEQKIRALTENSYGRQFLKPLGLLEKYETAIKKLCAEVEITSLVREKAKNTVEELGNLILQEAEK